MKDINGFPAQAQAFLLGNTMSSEFDTALKNLSELQEIQERCEKGEITVSDIKGRLKEIITDIKVLEEAESVTNGKNLELAEPSKNKEKQGIEIGE